VLAGDESDSAWTTNITAEQLERAFVLSSKIRPLLRSEIPAEAMKELSDTPLHELERLSEAAAQVGARYVAIGHCLELSEQAVFALSNFKPVRWSAVVRLQLLDAETGQVVASQGFDARTQAIHNLDGKAGYQELMKRFARDFTAKVDRNLPQYH
jgi:hypothetical protein